MHRKQHERTWMFTLICEVIWEFLNEEMMLDFSIINLCKISVVIHSNFSKQIEMTCQLRNVGFSPFIDFIGFFF